jgi:hypothetical protein
MQGQCHSQQHSQQRYCRQGSQETGAGELGSLVNCLLLLARLKPRTDDEHVPMAPCVVFVVKWASHRL